MSSLEQYLREMEESNLLHLLYNGFRYINGQPAIEAVTLETVMEDEGFLAFTKNNLNDEYIKGI